jgi:hypothetical protein
MLRRIAVVSSVAFATGLVSSLALTIASAYALRTHLPASSAAR